MMLMTGDVFAHTFLGFGLFQGLNQAYNCFFVVYMNKMDTFTRHFHF
jgi:hypothetical protein